ncbi:MAG: hypothetical protein E3J72_15450 [Planctomycetota bacterium]|nr:MAG: hypothetical protein E3J72_15450 [Planctomycetota bacterium]
MLRINMLPPACRQAVGTPISVALMLMSALGLGVICVTAFLWTGSQARAILKERAAFRKMQHRIDELTRQRNDLDVTLRLSGARRDSILRIRKKRILWAKKLDRLARKTPESSIWWRTLRMDQVDTAPVPGSLTVECLQKGSDMAVMEEYRVAIRGDRIFWRDFASMSPPGFKLMEGDMLSYALTFYLKPFEVTAADALPHLKRNGGGQ